MAYISLLQEVRNTAVKKCCAIVRAFGKVTPEVVHIICFLEMKKHILASGLFNEVHYIDLRDAKCWGRGLFR